MRSIYFPKNKLALFQQRFKISYKIGKNKKGESEMAKNNIEKLEKDLAATLAKAESIKVKMAEAKEKNQKEIGKLFSQIQFKKNKNISYEEIILDLKTELGLIKEEEKEKRKLAQKEKENNFENPQFTEDLSVENG